MLVFSPARLLNTECWHDKILLKSKLLRREEKQFINITDYIEASLYLQTHSTLPLCLIFLLDAVLTTSRYVNINNINTLTLLECRHCGAPTNLTFSPVNINP